MEMHRIYSFQGSALYRMFDQTIRENDLEGLEQLCQDGFEDVDSEQDRSGTTLYHSAIDNGNIGALRILVDHQVPMYNDGFIHAVRSRNPEMVRVFAENLLNYGIADGYTPYTQTPCYPGNTTPLMIAAELKDIKSMKILIDIGHEFPELEDYRKDAGDGYQRALRTVGWYRARCSEGLIVLTSEDPLAMIFELAEALKEEFIIYPELSDQLSEIERDLCRLAGDLLTCAHDKEEAAILLEVGRKISEGKCPEERTCRHQRLPSSAPPIITNGLSLGCKEFISVKYCQEYMVDRWYQSGPRWRIMTTPFFIIASLLVCLGSPLLWILIFLPFARLKQYINSPYVRFLSHVTSDVIFLFLLIFTTIDVDIIVGYDDNDKKEISNYSDPQQFHLYKGLQVTRNKNLVFIWIFGMFWRNVHLLWTKGAKAYFSSPWHVIDYLQVCLYVAFLTTFSMANYWSLQMSSQYATMVTVPATTFSMADDTITVTIPPTTYPTTPSTINPSTPPPASFATPQFPEGPPDGSTLPFPSTTPFNPLTNRGAPPGPVIDDEEVDDGSDPSEGDKVLLSFRNMTRFDWDTYDPVFLCEASFAMANILTFIRMIHTCVILKFLGPLKISIEGMLIQTIKFLVLFSFVWISFAMGFSQLYRGFQRLQLFQCKSEGGDCGSIAPFISLSNSMGTLFWSLFDLPDLEMFHIPTKEPSIIQGLGLVLYGTYSIVAVFIMLNALIAMMSNHYTRIEENADMEWLFARTGFMVDYIQHITVIPPPLNIVHAVFSFLVKVIRSIWRVFLLLRGRKKQKTLPADCSCKELYKKIIHCVRVRYLQNRLTDINIRERAEQQTNRVERNLHELRTDLKKVTLDTERILEQLQQLGIGILKEPLTVQPSTVTNGEISL